MKRNTSIIILTYNNLEYTKACIESIEKYTDSNTYEIIVIDNNSTDGTKKWLESKKDLKVVYNQFNAGFPKGCNQGIEIANTNNDILLLNNDTIVTKNWLKNLKICLDSNEYIGAVGAVCNKDENRQGVDFSYNDFFTMQKLAEKNNISNPKKWEEKVFLIGFCILIKREVINKVKKLDEKYSPGYVEDNDLSLRIINEGYKLILCHDCFIHHYLGTEFRKDLSNFYSILYKNRDYFYRKWKFNTFSFDEIKSASFPLIKNPINILELNCGIGAGILELKYKLGNVRIDGVENDKYKIKFSSKFTKVYKKLSYANRKFYDYILIGDLLEKVNDPKKILNNLKSYLKRDGYIVGEIHNFANVKIISSLLNDNIYNITSNKKNIYTINDIKVILDDCGYKIDDNFFWYENFNDEEQILLDRFKQNNKNLEYTYYTFKAILK